MKIPKLIFALKCSVIVYITACTSIDKLAVTDSVTQLVTKGTWKVNCYTGTNNIDNTCNFQDYTFAFDKNGTVTAKKGESFKGRWLEDNISKKITISFDDSNLVLNELNDYWDITSIADGGITFETAKNFTLLLYKSFTNPLRKNAPEKLGAFIFGPWSAPATEEGTAITAGVANPIVLQAQRAGILVEKYFNHDCKAPSGRHF